MGLVHYLSEGNREDRQGREERQSRGDRGLYRGERVIEGTAGCRGERGS
jgi:hypothetical protein